MNKLKRVQPQALSKLLDGLGESSKDMMVTNICDDTRKLQKGEAFLCLPRVKDVEALLKQAESKGASLIIFVGKHAPNLDLPYATLPDMDAVGLMLRRWFGTEHTRVSCIGVTGTDGKTSVTWMLREVLGKHLGSAWSVGTLGWKTSKEEAQDLGNTTPSLMKLHEILAMAHQENIGALVLEVSSHGIEQQRIAGLSFSAAIWTTMGHDHLEDHGGFNAYLKLKSDFVKRVALDGGTVVANADYEDIQTSLDGIIGSVFWYGRDREADLLWHVEQGNLQLKDSEGVMELEQVPSADFHFENLASVAQLMKARFHVSLAEFKRFDGCVSTPQGRLQPLGVQGQVFIDYAHTAEGLKRCLQSARRLTEGQLFLVFGCGGNRDKSKRPEMGAVAMTYADVCWLTSDNPRDEKQSDIAEDVLQGMDEKKNLHVVDDRSLAIKQAVNALCDIDKLVVAGKGHEAYMEIQGKRLPWSDEGTVLQALQNCEVQSCA
ncbi:MAG: UDP-N-acetylmuramyl-tripeptide synthetase [Ghiorsea sp.]